MIFNIFVAYILILTLTSFRFRINTNLFYLNFLFITLLIGLRGYDIGSVDTLDYVRYFLELQNSYKLSWSDKELEIGFIVYNNILKSFLNEGWQYLLFNAVFSIAPLFYLIKKYSSNYQFSLLLFFIILWNNINVYLVCTRQVIAMAFILWAIAIFLNKPRFYIYIYIGLSAIGTSIHTSTFIMSAVFMVIYHITITRTAYVTICIVTCLLGLTNVLNNFTFTKIIFSQLDFMSKLSGYTNVDFSGSMGYLYVIFITLIGIMISAILENQLFNSIFNKLFLVGIAIHNVFPTFQENYRLAGLFTIFGLIAIPYLGTTLFSRKPFKNHINLINHSAQRLIAKPVFLLIILYSYLNFAISNTYKEETVKENIITVPYQFFWEDKYNY